MVKMARFSSDDPGWVDPDDRVRDRGVEDLLDWNNPFARPARRTKRPRRRPNSKAESRVPDPRRRQAGARLRGQ
jgi:hypothetical protein